MAFYVDALVNSGTHTALGGDATTSSPQVPVVFEFNYASGGPEQAKVVPYDCQVIYAFALKSGSAGVAGDLVDLQKDGVTMGQFNLSGSTAGSLSIAGLDVTETSFTAGQVLGTSGTLDTDNACRIYVSALVR